jgi:deazaflavin-dependent oxidoreductase (nitroreductase family)
MIIVAANSGGPSQPDWFLNLKAAPAARVEIKGRAMRVRAEELPAADAESFWPHILRRAPAYATYRKATGRAIPLVRLVPVDPGEGALP